MAGTQHSPGPWWAQIYPSRAAGVNVAFDIRHRDGRSIAHGQSQEHLGDDGIHQAECEANARLLAAAPALLRALRTCQTFINEGPATRVAAEVAQEVSAAIASAVGDAD